MIEKLYELMAKVGITYRQDEVLHFLAGFMIALIVSYIAFYLGFDYPQTYGFLAGILAGLCKELYDMYDYGRFGFFDLFATLIGAFFGGAIVVLVS